mmetsp:Transcript_14049/g.23450  ORF Transcript_14049/g.23450 Transcript_14049/m.23450 type:complete len:482 (+) Transcript_14049:2330-3775(+)
MPNLALLLQPEHHTSPHEPYANSLAYSNGHSWMHPAPSSLSHSSFSTLPATHYSPSPSAPFVPRRYDPRAGSASSSSSSAAAAASSPSSSSLSSFPLLPSIPQYPSPLPSPSPSTHAPPAVDLPVEAGPGPGGVSGPPSVWFCRMRNPGTAPEDTDVNPIMCTINSVWHSLVKVFPEVHQLPAPGTSGLWSALLRDRAQYVLHGSFVSSLAAQLNIREQWGAGDVLEGIRQHRDDHPDLRTWVDSFTCSISYSVLCECGYEDTETWENSFLQLPCTPPRGSSIQDQVEDYFYPNSVDPELKFTCRKCTADKQHTRAVRSFRPPQTVIFQLDPRAQMPHVPSAGEKSVNSKSKNERGVLQFLSYRIDEHIQVPIVSDGEVGGSTDYDLLGIVVHMGPSFSSGHNQAIVRDPEGVWALVDDTRVTDILDSLDSWDVNRMPVLTFYTAVSTEPGHDSDPRLASDASHPLLRPSSRPPGFGFETS